MSVPLSIGWSVCQSVRHALENITFEQISARGDKLGTLDATLHLYKMVCVSIGL